MNHIKSLIASFLAIMFFCHFSLNQCKAQDLQIKLLNECLNKAKADTLRIMAMYNLYLYYINEKTDSAVYYSKKAYLLSKKTNNYELGRVAMALGHAYHQAGDYEKAITYLTEAYNVAKKQGYKEVYSLLLSDIGTCFLFLNDYDKADSYFNNALKVCIDYNGKIVTYFNLAQVKASTNKYAEAHSYYNKALELAKNEKNVTDEALIYNRLGELSLMENDFKNGLYYYNKSLSMIDPNNLYYKVTCLAGLAKVHLLTKDYKKGVKYALQADSIAQESGFTFEESSLNKTLSELYDSLRMSDLALLHYKIYSWLNDSIVTIEKNDRISYLQVEFETKEKELQLELMQKEATLRNRMIIMYFILSVLVVMILIYFIKNVRQKNKRLAFENEKELFLKQKLELEIHQKNRELLTHALQISQQKDVLTSVQAEIVNVLNIKSAERLMPAINSLSNDIKTKISMSDNWSQIKIHFEKVHPHFFNQLKKDFPDLSINDLKLCAYTKLNFSGKEIGQLLNINHTSVQMARYRLKKKMGIAEEMSFNDFILSQF